MIQGVFLLISPTHTFFSFLAPCGIWSSWARDQIQATVVTYVIPAAVLDPLTHWAGPEITPASWHCKDTTLLHHSKTPSTFGFFFFFFPIKVLQIHWSFLAVCFASIPFPSLWCRNHYSDISVKMVLCSINICWSPVIYWSLYEAHASWQLC